MGRRRAGRARQRRRRGSAAAAAEAVQLGHSLRRALLRAADAERAALSSPGGPDAAESGGSAGELLAQLSRLLHPPPGDEAAARGVEAVLDAVGWELFDGLVGLLAPLPPPHSLAGDDHTALPDGSAPVSHSATLEPEPEGPGASPHLLARACAARVLQHSGSGRDLRRLAATLALGVASSPSALCGPGWRQALSALTAPWVRRDAKLAQDVLDTIPRPGLRLRRPRRQEGGRCGRRRRGPELSMHDYIGVGVNMFCISTLCTSKCIIILLDRVPASCHHSLGSDPSPA